MKELFRTNNAVRLSFAQALLRDQGMTPVMLDQHMSILDGSIGALPRRLMVADEDHAHALRVLIDAGVIEERPSEEQRIVPARGSEIDSLGTLSDDGFLGGRLRILQPETGFRAAIDSVMLPAAVDPENGLDILDAGIGAGVASLCLLARVPAFRVSGIEIDTALAGLARLNAERNGFAIDVVCGDLLRPARAAAARFDQVMTNPPYFESGQGTAPRSARAGSRVMLAGHDSTALKSWIAACLHVLRPGGVLTLIHRAERGEEILAAFGDRAGNAEVFPLWPRPGEPARRILVRARLGGTAPPRRLAGLTLHGAAEKYTAQAEAILRHGAGLDWDHDSGPRAP